MRGHVQFIGVSSVHPGQMVTEINFKFCKGLKGIKIILAPYDIIILDKLDKTVKIDIFIKVISRDIHSITIPRCKIGTGKNIGRIDTWC